MEANVSVNPITVGGPELALIFCNPNHPGEFISQHFSVNVNQVSSQDLEDDLKFVGNWKKTLFY